MVEQTSHFVVSFEPVAFTIFGWGVHWYGLMYLVGFTGGWWIARYLARRNTHWGMTAQHVDDLLFYMGLGVILGARVGYVLFYDMGNILAQATLTDSLWRIISIHKGGMSFHGGLLGVVLGLWLFNRKYKHGFFVLTDMMAMIAPLGLCAGRIGNFINGELWGKPSDVAWAMIFPHSNTLQPRHPTPLYEAFLEGVVLFILVWGFARRSPPTMAISGLFALCYGAFRIFVEFFRLPDAHIGYLAFDWLTMGMLLSAPLCVVGVILLWYAYNNNKLQNTA